MKYQTTKEKLLAVQVPEKTRTYTPIPHNLFIEELQSSIIKKGYHIENEHFISSFDGKIMSGRFSLNDTRDPDLKPAVSILNSYNKMKRGEIRVSAVVLVCKNGMMGTIEQGYYSRKHNGNAYEDFKERIDIVVDNLDKEFDRLVTNKNEMKSVELTPDRLSYLIGDMLFKEGIIGAHEYSALVEELKKTENFQGNTVWDLYNNITQVYKDSTVFDHDRKHVKLHTYMADKFDLTGSRHLYSPIPL